MNTSGFVSFVRERGLAVVATRSADGAPEAALVGVACTDAGELIFDTSIDSRKYRNISEFDRVAVVIGWDDETTVQCEGRAEVLTGAARDRCLPVYFAQYPDGRDRAESSTIAHMRIRPDWLRRSDFRPDSFAVEEFQLDADAPEA